MARESGRPTAAEMARLEILHGVALESVAGFLSQCPVLELAQGEALLRRGRTNANLYLLIEGRLAVHLDGLEREPVAELEAGVSVGELSVIDDSPASADVVAAAASRLLVVDEETFWRLVRASHEFAANLLALMARRMRATNTTARRLDHAATTDGLTGLRNRRWLEEQLARLVARELRDGRALSLAMVDVDHFKRFNDTHGHAAGDAALVAVAGIIVRQIRPLDLAARYGGEEMVIVFPATPLAGALTAAERVRRAVAGLELRLRDGGVANITLSVGVAEVGGGEDARAVLGRADRALYRAKELGRNRVEASTAHDDRPVELPPGAGKAGGSGGQSPPGRQPDE